MSRRLPRYLCVIGTAFAMLMICGSALAFFSSRGSGTASAAVTQLGTPTITAATPAAGGTVAISWNAIAAPGSGTVSYYVTRNGGDPGGDCPVKATPAATQSSCTDSGLAPGTYKYKVTALFRTWSTASVVVSAEVTVGPVSKFAISGTPTNPAVGGAVNLNITAQDAAGSTVEAFTGSHSLVFSGAAESPGGTAPSVANASGSAIAFGTATALTFTNGVAAVAKVKNGVLKIYKAGEASVTATEGSLTTPVPLAVNVAPAAASRYTLAAASATPVAGAGDSLTITALDTYGNSVTTYTGTHNLVFSGASNSPSGTVPTVSASNGAAVAFGTATPITFSAGVATASGGENGEMILYKAGSTSIKAAEGTTVTTATALVVTVGSEAAASLTLTAAKTTPVAAANDRLTTTAEDPYGNTATDYAGPKILTFTGAEASPSGAAPTVVDSAGATVNFDTPTPIDFTAGVARVAAGKNGVMKLNKAGSAGVTATDGTLTTAPLAFTVAVGTPKRVVFSDLTVAAGTIGSPCFFTCPITLLGNSGTVSSALAITDKVGNTASDLGAGKTVSVSAGGTAGSSISGSPLTLPETGPAVTLTPFAYTAPGTGAYSNKITATSTGFKAATATISR